MPAAAVRPDSGGAAVWVVEGGRVARRAVTLGAETGGRVEVRAGLAGGETVVLGPGPTLRDGLKVRLRRP